MNIRVSGFFLVWILLFAGTKDLAAQKYFFFGGGFSTHLLMNPRPIGPYRSHRNTQVIGNSLDLNMRIPFGKFSLTPMYEVLGFPVWSGRQYFFYMENPKIVDGNQPTMMIVPQSQPPEPYIFGPSYSKRQALSEFVQHSFGIFATYNVEEDVGIGTGIFIQKRWNYFWEDKLRDAFKYSYSNGQNDFYEYEYSYYYGPEYHFIKSFDVSIPIIVNLENQRHGSISGYQAILWLSPGDTYLSFRATYGIYSKNWKRKKHPSA